MNLHDADCFVKLCVLIQVHGEFAMLKRARNTLIPAPTPHPKLPLVTPLSIPFIGPDRCGLTVPARLLSTATRNNSDASGKLPRVSKKLIQLGFGQSER